MSSYHGWTHAQKEDGGTDPIPLTLSGFPWIRIGQYSRDASDSLWTKVPFRFLNYDPALVTEDVDFSWTQSSDGLGHNIWKVSTRKKGFYFYDLQVSWDLAGGSLTNDAATVGLRMTSEAANELSRLYSSADWFDGGLFVSGSQGEVEVSGVQRLSGIVYIGSSNREWIPQIIQTTGDTRTVGGDYLYIVRLMEDDGSSWTTLTST
jgi:hypothetical protein